MTSILYSQLAYRFYEDGTEAGAVAVAGAAQSTAITRTVVADSVLHVRIMMQNTNATGGGGSDTWTLQRAITRGGSQAIAGYLDVTSSSNGVKGFNSAIVDDAATTNRLGAGSGGVFFAGKVSEDGTTSLTITSANYTEFVFPVTLVAADLGHDDVITFRMARNAAVTGLTYTQTPTITISKVSTGYGGLKGVLRQTDGSSITNPSFANGAVTVVAGDLIYAHFNEQTNPTATGVTDNLGNSYTAVGAETDGGATAARAFSSVVTAAGSLTSVSFAATASSQNYNATAIVIEGLFTNPAQDVHPADTTTDTTSPLTCPATGTLSQADEYIIAAIAGGAWTFSASASTATLSAATSPQQILTSAGDNNAFQATVFLGWVVSSTATQTPELTSSANPSSIVYITASFKKAVAAVIGGATSWGYIFG